MTVKIWITFDNVSQLQIGGLERCKIWFQKPEYVYVDKNFDYGSLPFGGGNQKQGLTRIGWRFSRTEGKETGSISLGKVFDYEGDICEYVWDQLCLFFKSEDLRIWDEQEERLSLKPSDFLLELDTMFTLKN